jgi:hypothetical protein
LIVYYTGTAPPANTNIQVVPPLYYNPSLLTLGIVLPVNAGVDTGSTNALAANIQGYSAYQPGMTVNILPLHGTTSTTPNFNLNGFGSLTIVGPTGGALTSGDISTSAIAQMTLGPNFTWFLQNPQVSSGSGNVSGQANGVIPLATGASTIGAQSHLSDNGSQIISSEPIVVNGSTHGVTIAAGTAAAGAPGSVVYASDATNGYAEVNENNTGLSRVCTAANGICGGGTTTNALTMSNSNTGDTSGSTFNGSAAKTISTNTIGAPNLAASNTYSGATTNDFSGTSQIKLPVAAGYASAANGEIGYDSTNLNWHAWSNAADQFVGVFPVSTPPTSGNCVEFSKIGNSWKLIDAGGPCGISGGGVTAFSGDGAFSNNSASTGSVTLTLANAAANTVWGNQTGGSTTPSYGKVALASHATQAADTVVMNATGGSAAPTAVAMPACTTGADLYNTTTHSWFCVSSGGLTAAPPYFTDGSNFFTPDGFQVTKPSGSPTWVNSVTPGTIASGANGNLLLTTGTGGTSYFSQIAGTTSTIGVFRCFNLSATNASKQAQCGIWMYDSTNSKIYVMSIHGGSGSTLSQMAIDTTIDVYTYSGSGNPSYSTTPATAMMGAYGWGPYAYEKIVKSSTNLLFQVSLDGGATYQTVYTQSSIGTLADGGFFLTDGTVGVTANVVSLAVN